MAAPVSTRCDPICAEFDPKSAVTVLELQPLWRQGSTASSDTYASCHTHPQSSPSNYDSTPPEQVAPPRHNVYINPLDQHHAASFDSPDSEGLNRASPLYECNSCKHYKRFEACPCRFPAAALQGPDQLVQKLIPGVTTTWQPQRSPHSPRSRSNPRDISATGSSFKRGMKRHKTLGAKPRARFSDMDNHRCHSSLESINSQISGKQRLNNAPAPTKMHTQAHPFSRNWHEKHETNQKGKNKYFNLPSMITTFL